MAAKIKRLPTTPGVYLLLNTAGKILYIGKAVNIRNRVRSHFQMKPAASPGKIGLYENVAKIDWRETDSEIEALILEANLIKKYQPAFNVDLKDSKNYLFVGFTKEEFPHVFVTHQLARPRRPRAARIRAHLIGPFTSVAAVKQTMNALRRVFPYCTCTELHSRPCVRAEVGKCLTICCLKPEARLKMPANEQSELTRRYQKNIRAIRAILTGRNKQLRHALTQSIETAAKRHRFEYAAKLRDQYLALEDIFQHERVLSRFGVELPRESHGARLSELRDLQRAFQLETLPRRIEAYDIANIQGELATGSMVTFENGLPSKNFYRKFKIKISSRPNDVAMLREVLQRRIAHTEWPYPDLIVVDGGKAQRNTFLSVLRVYKLNIPVLGHAKGLNEIHWVGGTTALADLTEGARNILLRLRDEAHRFARRYFHWRQRKAIADTTLF